MSVEEPKGSVVRRQLTGNAVRDPVAKLPLELSSKIFIHCLPLRSEPCFRHVPMLLLNVCRTWSDVALSTPALWATIHIEFPRGKGFSDFLAMWLKRAGNHLLSISLQDVFDAGVAAIVWEHASQLKNLEIRHDDYHPHLWTPVGLGQFLFLQTLTLACFKSFIHFSVHKILEILHHTPNLVECTIGWVILVNKDYPYTITRVLPRLTETLVLPRLRYLNFGRTETETDFANLEGDGRLLTYLTLPALETLVVPTLDISHVLSFLVRSSPPLQKLLLIGLENETVNFTQLHKCLRLVPFITHFEFRDASTDLMDDLWTALADSLSTFLPNLRILKLHHCWSDMEDFFEPSYVELLRVLKARRSQIVCFELILSADGVTSDYGGPDAKMRAAFRQLVAEGMEIHIGDIGENFLEEDSEGEDWDDDVDEDEDRYEDYSEDDYEDF